MNKAACITFFAFMIMVGSIMAYPLYSIFKTVGENTPPSYHEYTVLDLRTNKKMIVVGDDNKHVFHADDTAWRTDRILYKEAKQAPDNAMQVVIIASYNQLYQ